MAKHEFSSKAGKKKRSDKDQKKPENLGNVTILPEKKSCKFLIFFLMFFLKSLHCKKHKIHIFLIKKSDRRLRGRRRGLSKMSSQPRKSLWYCKGGPWSATFISQYQQIPRVATKCQKLDT